MSKKESYRVERLVVPITVEEQKALDALALAERRPKAVLIRMALEKALPAIFLPKGKA
jgi:hypothetical protein